MNVKKTIAAIAAIAMAVSTTSLAPLFTGISVSAEGEAIGAENTDVLADPNAGISPFVMSSEDEELPVPEPVPDVTPDVYLIGGSTATTGTYTATLEIEGASANTVTITVVVYGTVVVCEKNIEFTRRADGKYTADIEITNENLEGFKKGFVIYPFDEKSYTIKKAEAVIKAEEEPSEPEPVPDVTPDVYLIGGSTATTGTYTVTIEMVGSPNAAAITVIIYGENIEFIRRADGRYTADIEITNENLEAFKKGFLLGTLDEKTYTIKAAEYVKKAEEEPSEPEPIPVVTPDVYLIGGSTAATGTYTVTLEIEGASANTVAITVVVYGENIEFTRRANGRYTADIEITNENLEAFKEGFVIYPFDEKSYTIKRAEAVIKAEEKPPVNDNDTLAPTPAKPAPAPVVPYYPPAITNTPINPSSDTSAATVSTPVQITASPKSNITINAAETDVTSAMLEAFTKNRAAKTMTLRCNSKLKIVINKSDISGTYAKLDFSLSGKKFLPSKLIKNNKTLSEAEKIFQLDFISEGDFGDVDKVTVKFRVGARFAGKTAAVYEYADGKLVKVGKCRVGGSGLVNFKTNHFGQFIIAVE